MRLSLVASKVTDGGDADHVVDNLLQSISSESRLKKEFKIIQMIGSGGFGDIIKVQISALLLYRKSLIEKRFTKVIQYQ